MRIENFAAMTIPDFKKLVAQGVDMRAVFTAYAQKHAAATQKLNLWIDFYGYETNDIPVSIKGNIYMKGKRVTCASKMLQNFYAPYDSTLVRMLKEDTKYKFQIIGTTNMDELAMGSHGITSCFGPALNPNSLQHKYFDVDAVLKLPYEEILSPGGSSSGMAPSVAAGLCLLGFGTDTGGSTRVGPEYTGLCQAAFTHGFISRDGVVELSSRLDRVGVTAKEPCDIRIWLDVASKKQYNEDSIHTMQLINRPRTHKIAVLDPRIGAWCTSGYAAIQRTIAIARSKGYVVDELVIDHTLLGFVEMLYMLTCCSDAASSIGTLNVLLYGSSDKMDTTGDICERIFKKPRTSMLGDEPKRRSVLGHMIISAPEKPLDKVRYIIQQLKKQFQDIFAQGYDAIITPVSCMPTSKIANPDWGARGAIISEMWLEVVNLIGCPVACVPVLHTPQGFFSTQIICKEWEDDKLVDIMSDLYKFDDTQGFNKEYRGTFAYIDDGQSEISFVNTNDLNEKLNPEDFKYLQQYAEVK
jgi:aspartyl-tRNA(Asn)/glutamyl-tRNA(Gln) amidotransferase subunit A